MSIKIFALILGFLLILGPASSSSFGYEEQIQKTYYRMSDSGEYLIQVWPMFETHPHVPHGIWRKSTTVAIYKKRVSRVEGVDEAIITFEEQNLFRIQLPHNVHDQGAEVQEALISNNGTRIAFRSAIHPQGKTDVPEIFIYDEEGDRVASFSRDDLFGNARAKVTQPDFSIQLDRPNAYLTIESPGHAAKRIDLELGRLLK